MSTHYDLLTEGEQAHWDEYATLRAISDWAGFTEDQDERRADARGWLQAKRKEIWRLAQPASEGGDGNGWDHADRRERYETLKDENLNSSTVQRKETTLPASNALDSERAVIEEREIWFQIDSTTDAQKARKQACTDWLIAQRKQLWHLMQDDPERNEANHRQQRYDNLCIATKYGSAYEAGTPATTSTASLRRPARAVRRRWITSRGASGTPRARRTPIRTIVQTGSRRASAQRRTVRRGWIMSRGAGAGASTLPMRRGWPASTPTWRRWLRSRTTQGQDRSAIADGRQTARRFSAAISR
jgi:hypothetical protein